MTRAGSVLTMDENERLLTACNQLASLARQAIHGAETGDTSDMWSTVYGTLNVTVDTPEQIAEAFTREYTTLNNAAVILVMALAQLYAERAGISDIEAIDQAQELAQGGLTG